MRNRVFWRLAIFLVLFFDIGTDIENVDFEKVINPLPHCLFLEFFK